MRPNQLAGGIGVGVLDPVKGVDDLGGLLVSGRQVSVGNPLEDVPQLVVVNVSQGVALAQDVAVRPLIPLAVLRYLVGNVAGRLVQVPVADGGPQAASPAPHVGDVGQELHQLAGRVGHVGELVKGQLPGEGIALGGAEGQGIEGHVGAGCPMIDGDVQDVPHRSRAVLLNAAFHGPDVFQGEGALLGVVAAALGPEDEEAG